MMKTRIILLSFLSIVLIGFWSTMSFSLLGSKREIPFDLLPVTLNQPTGTSGTLFLSSFQREANTSNPLRHESIFVNGQTYGGMEDNDIRGFLEGAYKHRWNQSGQVHVRVGRRGKSPHFGEYELFRVLQRWDDIKLPQSSRILQAHLTLAVEKGPSFPLHVYLYEVKKDWNPGSGGHRHDNNSRPNTGEVWWEEVAHTEERWGLPGAGFASDNHPDADISAMPLAMGRYIPGLQQISFSSPELVAYIASCLEREKPLLFLIKLSDTQEDLPGSRVHFYSANYGDIHMNEKRPHLYLQWENSHESQQVTKRILMEYGTSYVLPRIELRDADYLAASFVSEGGFEDPTFLIRGGNREEASSWELFDNLHLVSEWTWIELRLLAATHPLFLGNAFKSRLKDTWIKTGPPADQEVLWTFVSPSGKRHSLKGEYREDYTWDVHFHPDELGKWRYSWEQNFTFEPHTSDQESFDVIAGDLQSIENHLEILLEKIRTSNIKDPGPRIQYFEMPFLKVERAAMKAVKADHLTKKETYKVQFLLKQIRAALEGGSVPYEPIAFRDHSRKW